LDEYHLEWREVKRKVVLPDERQQRLPEFTTE
jgi:hypothetical protein